MSWNRAVQLSVNEVGSGARVVGAKETRDRAAALGSFEKHLNDSRLFLLRVDTFWSNVFKKLLKLKELFKLLIEPHR